MKPIKGSYPAYFETYISKVTEDDVLIALHNNLQACKQFFKSIPADKENSAYAQGKWTIKQVLNHILDCERIFAYRALRFARKDPQTLAAFDEDAYASVADVTNRNLGDLMAELEALRWSNIFLFKSLNEEALLRTGFMASGETTVLSLGYMICGHANHHMQVIKEKYLKDF